MRTQPPVVGRRLVIATDGSANPNPGPAGWGWWHDQRHWDCGSVPHATNNAMEFHAILAALRAAPKSRPVTILTDSQYAQRALTEWWTGWSRNNWLTKTGTPVSNRETIQMILDLKRGWDVNIQWVRGHHGHDMNEAADRLAREASRQAALNRRVIGGPGWPEPVEASLDLR